MQENRLWYRQPAKEWTDSLPLGNGRIRIRCWLCGFARIRRDRLRFGFR